VESSIGQLNLAKPSPPTTNICIYHVASKMSLIVSGFHVLYLSKAFLSITADMKESSSVTGPTCKKPKIIYNKIKHEDFVDNY
jgi:hypothetical protein